MLPETDINNSQIKCLFVGLDNGGKTSLLLTLEKKFLKILMTKPTKQIAISNFQVLGIPMKIWDMGGQKGYRKEYHSKLQYFDETKLLFYVIDIQDRDRFDAALDYFETIINTFVYLELSPKIIVILHKCDPDFKDTMQGNKNIYEISRALSNNPYTKDFPVYQTSIFNPEEFHRIFTQAVFETYPSGYKVQELLIQFMKDIEAEAGLIIDENPLIIAEASSNKKSLPFCRIYGKNLTNMARESFELEGIIPERIGIELLDGLIFFKHVPYLQTRFYLIFFTKKLQSLKELTELLPKFLSDLSTAIGSIVQT
jgi:GTP-binding protein EngB required for normal cell division